MRYYPARPIELAAIREALTAADPRFRVGDELHLGDELLGELEINVRGGELFDDELDEQLEELEGLDEDDADPDAVAQIVQQLQACDRVIVLRVLWQGRDADATLDMIAPLWTTLRALSPGLLQADGEGYYGPDGELLVELE